MFKRISLFLIGLCLCSCYTLTFAHSYQSKQYNPRFGYVYFYQIPADVNVRIPATRARKPVPPFGLSYLGRKNGVYQIAGYYSHKIISAQCSQPCQKIRLKTFISVQNKHVLMDDLEMSREDMLKDGSISSVLVRALDDARQGKLQQGNVKL
ncbi:hypothetical protein PT286_05450 [Neisseriaceae bacterium ESL0693]|nr:hypothetical protein [Neisseriaceae bacterium ESL0693]